MAMATKTENTLKIFLSGITKPRALKFGLKHHHIVNSHMFFLQKGANAQITNSYSQKTASPTAKITEKEYTINENHNLRVLCIETVSSKTIDAWGLNQILVCTKLTLVSRLSVVDLYKDYLYYVFLLTNGAALGVMFV